MGWATMTQRPVHFNEYAPNEPSLHHGGMGEAYCGAFSAGTIHTSNGLLVSCRACRREARRAIMVA